MSAENFDYDDVKKKRFRVYITFSGTVDMEIPENITNAKLFAEKAVLDQVYAGIDSTPDFVNTYKGNASQEFMDATEIIDKDTKEVLELAKQIEDSPGICGDWKCNKVSELQCKWEEVE